MSGEGEKGQEKDPDTHSLLSVEPDPGDQNLSRNQESDAQPSHPRAPKILVFNIIF